MKAIIYNRTSTKEQNPELQKQDCLDFCNCKELEVIDVKEEQASAYKKIKREVWDSVVSRAKAEKLNIVLWRYDRAFRNREEFYKFMKVMFEVYGVKVYSVTEPSILSFWDMLDKSYSDNPIFNELFQTILKAFWDFLIQQAGEQAEEESRKKSERVKLAVRNEEGITKSYKGNKWGRKALSTQKKNIIRELHSQNKNIRQIAQELNVSVGVVHKYITQIKEEKIEQNQEFSN